MIVYGGNHHHIKPSEQPLYEPDEEQQRGKGSYELKRQQARKRMLEELRRNPAHSKHGTLYGYQCGCRCPRCAEARAEYMEKRRAHL